MVAMKSAKSPGILWTDRTVSLTSQTSSTSPPAWSPSLPEGTQPAQVLPRGCRLLRGNAGEDLHQWLLLTERKTKSHENPNALPGLAMDREGKDLGAASQGLAHTYRL